MRTFRALLQLTRLDSSLLAFCGVFVPFSIRTQDVLRGATQAVPVLLTCMCTFVANDLDDIERDRVNHPARPLPSGVLSKQAAAVLYFVCLAAALLSVKRYIDEVTAFWYYGLIAMSISYGYIVEWLPSLKSVYVAAAIAVPTMIVAVSFPEEPRLYVVAGALFVFAVGRELFMDTEDRAADVTSLVHRIAPSQLAKLGLTVQAFGLLLLAGSFHSTSDICVLGAMAVLLGVAGAAWLSRGSHRTAIGLMKLEFLFGLYFLA